MHFYIHIYVQVHSYAYIWLYIYKYKQLYIHTDTHSYILTPYTPACEHFYVIVARLMAAPTSFTRL